MGLLTDRGNGDDRAPIEIYARLLSRMKMNMLIVSSPIYYCLEENSGTDSKKNYEHMQRLYDFCRRYYIEPVPEMQSFGHAKNVLQFLPEAVETTWVGDPDADPDDDIPLPQPYETFTGGYDTRYVLEKPFVIDTNSRPIQVYTKKNDIWQTEPLTRDTDYELVYNKVEFNLKNGYEVEDVIPEGDDTDRNYGIHIIHPDYPPSGMDFRVEYEFVNEPNVGGYESARHSYCPSIFNIELRTWMADRIEEVVHRLEPKYIHFGHDEPQQMHTCRLCNAVEGYTDGQGHVITPNGKLFGNDVNYLNSKYQYYFDQYSFRRTAPGKRFVAPIQIGPTNITADNVKTVRR